MLAPEDEIAPTPTVVINESFDTLYNDQIDNLIFQLENKIDSDDYNPSNYERYIDE